MQQSSKTWAIIGSGAIGCLWASYLRQAGHEVLLIGRSKTLSEKANNGQIDIQLSRVATSSNAPNALTANTSETELSHLRVDYCHIDDLATQTDRLDNIILATKSHQLIYACEQIKPYIPNGANIISLCNGMGFQSELADIFSSANIYAAMSTDGALLHSLLEVEHTGCGITFYGLIASGSSHQADSNDSADNSAIDDAIKYPSFFNPELELKVEVVENITLGLWKKFFINCVINTLTAIYNIKNGELLDESLQKNLVIPLCKELEKVKEKTPLKTNDQTDKAEQKLISPNFSILENVNNVAKITAANTSSMLKDRQNGKALELKYLNEFLLSFAQYHKIDLPISTKLYEMLIDEHSIQ